MTLGENIRNIRKSKNMSQKYIAQKIGKSDKYISKLEHGHLAPSLYTLIDIANVLEVPLTEIFTYTE